MLLSVVNPAYPLDAEYVPALTEVRGVRVSPDMAESLEKMLSDAEAAGCPIRLKEGYISFEEQKQRYDSAVQKYRKQSKMTLVKAEAQVKQTIPREGESEQQTGLLVKLDDDVKGRFENSAAYKWLTRNSLDYGFVLRYPSSENVGGLSFSPNLFRYVGVENAYQMRAYNMTFDEYASYMSFR
jgi:D-alanyl-D-alanine carboxypeptidase